MRSVSVTGTSELGVSEMAGIAGGCEWVCDLATGLAKGVKAGRRAGRAVKRGFERMTDALDR